MPNPSSIRFPEALRERVAATATAERRTFSSEVLYLVEAALDARTTARERAERRLVAELVATFDAEVVEG